jgi:radical SAM protein with 4Fe4S-binding SPASM domain
MFEIFFISYQEPNAEENWDNLKSRFPTAQRIHGVKGIHQAHIAAAKRSFTKMFYVVDGDAVIADDFNFDYDVPKSQRDHVHVWHSKNPINNLEYGYGGIKLLPKTKMLFMNLDKIDMTTSLSDNFHVIPQVSNITAFNTDPFNTWKSAFRECVKLSSKLIDRQDDNETAERLKIWCSVGQDKLFGEYAIAGAIAGSKYGSQNKENLEAIKKINDFEWLLDQFNNLYAVKNKINSNTICAVPWMHLNFEPNGKVVPCCLTSTFNYFSGDLKTQPIKEIWNSNNMKTLRKEMISGIEPAICTKCFSREKVTGESGRIYHNQEFSHVIKKIPEMTLEDGTCTSMELKYWDFRFSNLCNFKCRSCGPRYSSAWVPDAKKLGYTDQEKVWSIEQVNDKTNFDFLKEQINVVEKIYFAGGEPLMMPEHWQILEMLAENKRFDVKISYNTNASTWTYGKKNVLEYWKLWDYGKIEIWPSIDELGERAELLRSGTVWPKIDANLKELIKLPNLRIKPGITVGAWNVFRIPEILEYFLSIGLINEKQRFNNFFFNLLEYPDYYHIHILPDNYKNSIIEKLEQFVINYEKLYQVKIRSQFTHILHELQKPHSEACARKFIRITNDVDKVRNENMYDVIPEMKIVKDMYM